MKKLFILFIIFFFFSLLHNMGTGGELFSQDIHFSQFNASPQNLNPAQTGLFDGDWRFVGNSRTQWAAVPVPYNTYSISTDTRLKPKSDYWKNWLKDDVPAFGLIVNSDQAGDSKLSTTQIFLSIAYIKKLNKDSTHFISLGVQPGFTTQSFNVNALTFDNQYNGDSYNPAASSGENFSRTKITYFDVGGGLAYLWKKTQRKQINIGVSAFHLNTPVQSFFNNNSVKVNIKTTISGIAEFPVGEQWGLLPSFLYQNQGNSNETDIGMFGKYYLNPIDGMTTAISFGGFYRLKDAFIFVVNMDYRNFNVGISYDINTSNLVAATNNRGAFEISVIYIFKKPISFIAKKRVCPIYM